MLGDEAGILMSDDGDEAGILMSDDANIDSDSSSSLIGSEGSSGPPEDSMILQLEAEPEAGSDGVVEAGASSDDEPLLEGASEQLGAGGWQPGSNCGSWMSSGHRELSEQGQVLIMNAFCNASKVHPALVRSLIPAAVRCKERKTGAALQLLSWLMCVSVKFVRRVVKSASAVTEGGWKPCARRAPASAGGSAMQEEDAELLSMDKDSALKHLVREAGGVAYEGLSANAFLLRCARYNAHARQSEALGRYISKGFFNQVVSMLAMNLRELDALDFDRILPGLGIPSDVALLADPVHMGREIYSKWDTLNVLCLGLISAFSGLPWSPMHSGHAMALGEKGGERMALGILASLLAHPAAWGLRALQARVASVGADGGLTVGGDRHRHGSADAAAILWRRIHPYAEDIVCVYWDPFHRFDVAVWRAVGRHKGVEAIFDLAEEMNRLFGVNEGAVMFRGLAAYRASKAAGMHAKGGTRFVYKSYAPASIVKNYPLLVEGIWLRVEWVQAGHTSQSIRDLLSIGMVVFIRACNHLMLWYVYK